MKYLRESLQKSNVSPSSGSDKKLQQEDLQQNSPVYQDQGLDPNFDPLLKQHKESKSANMSLESSSIAAADHKHYHNLTDFDIALNEAKDKPRRESALGEPDEGTQAAGQMESSVSFHEPRRQEFVIIDDKSMTKNRSFESLTKQASSARASNLTGLSGASFYPHEWDHKRKPSQELFKLASQPPPVYYAAENNPSQPQSQPQEIAETASPEGVKQPEKCGSNTATFRESESAVHSQIRTEILRDEIDELNGEISSLQQKINSAIKRKKQHPDAVISSP